MRSVLKILTMIVALAVATPALAGDGRHHGRGGHHGGDGGNWVAPFVGGAIVGAFAPYSVVPSPYYAPAPYQPYYHWDCDPYGRCTWVWR